jgi:hypothetical protein
LGALTGLGPTATPGVSPPKQLFNNLREGIKAGCATRAAANCAEGVITTPFLRVAEYFVGFVDELELLLGIGIIGIAVGVVL